MLKICTVPHIFSFLQEAENQTWATNGALTFMSVRRLPWEERVELHGLGVPTLANPAEARGREKSQLLFWFRDQSLICKRVSCQLREVSKKEVYQGLFHKGMGIYGGDDGRAWWFFEFVFPCLVWQAEARDSSLFSDVESTQMFVNTKVRVAMKFHP